MISLEASEFAPLFVPPGHFYSPIVVPAEAERRIAALESSPWPETVPGIALDRAGLRRTWLSLVPAMRNAPFADSPGNLRYGYDNNAYAWGDGAILQAMIRRYSPQRIIEVGSGWSSACMLDTVDTYLDGDCDLTFIEPYPALLHRLVGDLEARATVLPHRLQSVPLETFDALEADDILFIDSTHVVRTGSDCCTAIFDILPRLRPGVMIHIHDMFWPFEYPRLWAVEENRSWNEIYLVRALLTNNPDYEIIMFNDFMAKMEADLVCDTFPDFMRASGAALWLRKR